MKAFLRASLWSDFEMRRSFGVLALAAVAVSPVWAVYGISTGPASSDTTFQWVGQVGGASGVLIDPHWVLTAGHVGGNQFTLNGTTYTADATFNHPTADLHLMHFAETFGGFYSLYSGSTTDHIANIVGFGNTATQRTDHKGYQDVGSAGTRRAATNNIAFSTPIASGSFNTICIAADLDSADPDTPSPYNRDWFTDGGATANEGGVLAGDSGGAWLIDTGGGNYQLAGISLYIATDDQNAPPGEAMLYGAYGFSGAAAADLTNALNRDWVTSTVPEPASMSILALGLTGALFRKRRRGSK
jgi:hypothetical protein